MEPVLRLWLENDGSTAHLVNAAGAKIASGHIVPPEGTIAMLRHDAPARAQGYGLGQGIPVSCELRFEGTVV